MKNWHEKFKCNQYILYCIDIWQVKYPNQNDSEWPETKCVITGIWTNMPFNPKMCHAQHHKCWNKLKVKIIHVTGIASAFNRHLGTNFLYNTWDEMGIFITSLKLNKKNAQLEDKTNFKRTSIQQKSYRATRCEAITPATSTTSAWLTPSLPLSLAALCRVVMALRMSPSDVSSNACTAWHKIFTPQVKAVDSTSRKHKSKLLSLTCYTGNFTWRYLPTDTSECAPT